MRRTRPTMRRAVDYSMMPYWVYQVDDAKAEVLRIKDQDSRNSKK